MRPPGLLEIILIIVIVLIILGTGRLPQIFEVAGKGIRALRGGKKSEETEQVNTTKSSKKRRKNRHRLDDIFLLQKGIREQFEA